MALLLFIVNSLFILFIDISSLCAAGSKKTTSQGQIHVLECINQENSILLQYKEPSQGFAYYTIAITIHQGQKCCSHFETILLHLCIYIPYLHIIFKNVFCCSEIQL